MRDTEFWSRISIEVAWLKVIILAPLGLVLRRETSTNAHVKLLNAFVLYVTEFPALDTNEPRSSTI